MKRHRSFLLAVLLTCLAFLCGCTESEDKKIASQVAAKVNSDEITVHQVNSVLARNPNITPELAARAKREIVDQLIDQQLARQQAIEKKLDRSPEVVQAIEAAKSEILARAYLRQVAAAQAKPTPEEVKNYYAEHPELFANRRLYLLEEITIGQNDGFAATLRERVAKARSMQEIADWLKAREVQSAVNRGTRAAEQIPLEMLPKVAAMKDGEIQVIEVGDRLYVIRVVATKAAPVDEAAATPRIHQYLLNRRSNEALVQEMKRLKERVKIEYGGEFAGGAAAAEAKSAAASDAEQRSALNLEKGVRGLR